jgi:quercetin dioxygenase-like cupin family protein
VSIRFDAVIDDDFEGGPMKLALIGLALSAALVAAAPSVGAGTPIVARALGVGTVKTPFTVKAKPGSMIVESITIKPGGNFGWHTHGSAVAVVITGGTLTVFDPSVSNCAPFKVSKGQSFVEPAGHLHLARNDGAKPVTLYAIYLGVPKGVQPNIPGTQPSGCNA